MISKDEFIVILREQELNEQEMVQRYITHGSSFVFDEDDGKYFKLKKIIADKFELRPEEVIMVGSAKLGFSIAPSKLWKSFDDESDIDMVIVSEEIFDKFWIDLYDFNLELIDRTEEEQKRYNKFLDYLPDAENYANVIKVIDVSRKDNKKMKIYADPVKQRGILYLE